MASVDTMKDCNQGSINEFDETTGQHTFEKNSWIDPGQAAFDFRGDVRTSPTAKMLKAITSATLLDGLDGSDLSTKSLEDNMASLAGTEAALFVPSGTMGNLVSLRSLLAQPPYAILCDSRAHALNNEAGGAFAFAGAIPQPVTPKNGEYLTLEDILPHVRIETGLQEVHVCPTRVILLENTLRGMIQPLEEARRISVFAREHNIRIHLDGARLWEVVAAGEGSIAEFCSLFDTVTVCLSKGLGAPAGAIVVGSRAVIRQARFVRQSIGGSIRQPGLLAAAAQVAIDTTFHEGLLTKSHRIAEDIASYWLACGGKLQHPTHTNMVWLDFSGLEFTLKDLARVGREKQIIIQRNRLVIHYQICPAAVEALKIAMRELFEAR